MRIDQYYASKSQAHCMVHQIWDSFLLYLSRLVWWYCFIKSDSYSHMMFLLINLEYIVQKSWWKYRRWKFKAITPGANLYCLEYTGVHIWWQQIYVQFLFKLCVIHLLEVLVSMNKLFFTPEIHILNLIVISLTFGHENFCSDFGIVDKIVEKQDSITKNVEEFEKPFPLFTLLVKVSMENQNFESFLPWIWIILLSSNYLHKSSCILSQ